jgi:hypothetical protein
MMTDLSGVNDLDVSGLSGWGMMTTWGIAPRDCATCVGIPPRDSKVTSEYRNTFRSSCKVSVIDV